jgi:hypothetical protein
MGDIKFKFKLEELIRAIVFFAQNGISDFTKLKVAKLLLQRFTIDQSQLVRWANRPIEATIGEE